MSESKKILVVDSGPLIKGFVLRHDEADEFFTTSGVMEELKDERTRAALGVLPTELKVREPTPEAIAAVVKAAKACGLLQTISRTDASVIALAWTFMKELNCFPVEEENTEEVTTDATNEIEEGTDDMEGDEPEEEEPEEMEPSEVNGEQSETSTAVDDDGDGEWITPGNINKFRKGEASKTFQSIKESSVGCVTTDFAMQNVLLSLRIPVVSVDGLVIRKVKTFVRKCHACFTIFENPNLEFCDRCGGNTLMRISKTVDNKGRVYYSKGIRNFNLRGTKYSVPLPKGGRNSKDPVLRGDQVASKSKLFEHKQNRDPRFALAAADYASFSTASGKITAARSNKNRPELSGEDFWSMSGLGGFKRNPNDASRFRKGKRKGK